MASHLQRRSVSPARSASPRSMSRSPPRRSISPRSATRSQSRSLTPRGPHGDGGRGRSFSRSPSRGSRRASRSPAGSSKIVVEKLTKNVQEAHLKEIFGTYGEIKSIDMPLNRQFMTNRGTAYIVYEYMSDAESAIANMHEAQIDGAYINVSVVLPRRKFSRSPSPSRRLASHLDRGPPRGYGGPPPRGGRYGGRDRSPPRRGGRGGREHFDTYRPRSYTRSRSPMRSRSRSYTRSGSRSPPPRSRGGRGSSYRQRNSPPPRGRRRSPSYSSYDSYSDRGRSISRSPPRR